MDDAVIVDDLIVGAIPANAIDLLWDKVLPFVKMVEEKAPYDIDIGIVKERLQMGQTMLITISRGSDIVAINIVDVKMLDTGVKALFIPITAGGEMDLWLDKFMDIAIAIAKDYGCSELRGLASRDGWLRKLKPYGWEPVFTTIRCDIGE